MLLFFHVNAFIYAIMQQCSKGGRACTVVLKEFVLKMSRVCLLAYISQYIW